MALCRTRISWAGANVARGRVVAMWMVLCGDGALTPPAEERPGVPPTVAVLVTGTLRTPSPRGDWVTTCYM